MDHHAATVVVRGELGALGILARACEDATDQRVVHSADERGLVLCDLMERAVAKNDVAAADHGRLVAARAEASHELRPGASS